MEFINIVENRFANYIHSLTSAPESESKQISLPRHQILYLVKGNVRIEKEGMELTPSPGTVFLFSPQDLYTVSRLDSAPLEYIYLTFEESYLPEQNQELLLQPFQNKQPDSQFVLYDNINRMGLEHLLFDIGKYTDFPDALRNAVLSVSLEKFLLELVLRDNEAFKTTVQPKQTDPTINDIVDYLNANITSQISLDMLAERFYISKHHLNKKFKKFTGTTIGEYITRKRVIRAYQLISNGESAYNAAMASGFNDYSVFYRACKKIWGHAPIKGRTPPAK